jgi:hypothetical protein
MSNGQPKTATPAAPLLSEGTGSGNSQSEYRDPRFAQLDAMINAENHAKRRRKKPARKHRLSAMPGVHKEAAACVAPKPAAKRAELDGVVSQFAAHLCRDFADEIAADPKGFKKQATHHLKRHLPPFAGRPTEDSITKAIDLRKRGNQWKTIYPLVIPNRAQLDAAVRRQAESNLRAAVRSRRNAAKRRKRRQQLSAEAKPARNVPPRQGHEPDLNWGRNHEEAHTRTDPRPQGEGGALRQ